MPSADQPADNSAPDDVKERMREALERKKGNHAGVAHPAGSKEKAHGSEVRGGATPKVHRRKAGGGGA
ncbi:MAG: DUF5302 domain-containing protein [Nocardioidaceae bacterium]|nr:DUF5302 domain-containing protein [Nocardioidaceae bacterium]